MFIHEAGSEVVVVDGGGECDGVGDILLVAPVDVFVLVGLEVLLVAAVVVAGRNLGGGDVPQGHMTPIQTPEIGVALGHIRTAPTHSLNIVIVLRIMDKLILAWHMWLIGTQRPSPAQVKCASWYRNWLQKNVM